MSPRGPEDRSGGGLSTAQAAAKRLFDVTVAAVVLLAAFWLIALAWAAASVDTRANGFFTQQRVGRHGRRFRVIKLRTMRRDPAVTTSVTTSADTRITHLGRFFRKTKLDELPQFINVLVGDMSLVGPRPDVAGYADRLTGRDRIILTVRPGITGPATLKYRDEESLLAEQPDPRRYNDEVIFPDKVKINREYVENWSFTKDIRYIVETVIGKGTGARGPGPGAK